MESFLLYILLLDVCPKFSFPTHHCLKLEYLLLACKMLWFHEDLKIQKRWSLSQGCIDERRPDTSVATKLGFGWHILLSLWDVQPQLQKTDLTPFRETDNFQTSIRCSDDLQTLLEIPNDAHMSSKTFWMCLYKELIRIRIWRVRQHVSPSYFTLGILPKGENVMNPSNLRGGGPHSFKVTFQA